MDFINCPWCSQRNEQQILECRKCGGPLPAQSGEGLGPDPPPHPRKIPTGYKRRVLLTQSVLTLVGGIFFLVGLPFAVVFPIIGITTGMWLFIAIGGGLGGLFTILGGGMLFFGIQSGMNKIRPFEFGHPTIGEVIETFRDRSISINGRNPMAVIYSYEVEGYEYQGTAHSWKYGKQSQAVGDKVHVLYMPDEPEHSVIYPPLN